MYNIMESQNHQLVSMISYPNSGWGLDFTKGVCLDPNFGGGKILIEFESNHESLPDYFEIDGTPIVSEAFVRIWKSLPINNFQLFSIMAKFPAGQVQGHYILNVVGRVSCIDVDNSDCKMFEGSIMRIKNLVLKKDIMKELDLFRAHEYPLAIFISDRIREVLESSSLSGLLIKPADGWNDKHRF